MKDKLDKLSRLANNNDNFHEASVARHKIEQLKNKFANLKQNEDAIEEGAGSSRLLLLTGGKQKKDWRQVFTSLRNLIKVENEPMITLQIIPDQTAHSGRAVETFINTIYSMYEDVMSRVWNDGFSLIFKRASHTTFRVIYESGMITFYFIVPKPHERTIKNSISQIWPKSAIKETYEDIFEKIEPANAVCASLELKEHYFKSTLVDRTRNAPVESLVNASRNVIDDDFAVLDISLSPASKSWQKKARNARNKQRKGLEVRKNPSKLSDMLFMIGDFLIDGVIEKALSLLDAVIGADPEKDDLDVSLVNQRMKSSTEQKWTHNGFDTVIRIASQSSDVARANKTLISIGTAFKDVTGDNEFEIVPCPSDGRIFKPTSRIIEQMRNNKLPLFRLNGNILSVPEASQLIQLPSGALQQEYPEIVSIQTRETSIDERVRKGGMLLGTAKYKTQEIEVYQPCNDWDELCLPNILVGGMGSGKSTMLSNKLVEAYLNGFGALAIDAAKREIGDQVQFAVNAGIVKKEDFIRIDFGSTRISLDWIEATRHEKGRTRLATTIIDFFGVQEDTTGQTSRFLRAGALAMESGKLMEIFDIFEDEECLDKAIERLRDGTLAKKTLMQFKSFSPDRRRQVLLPIYNRLDDILGDEVLLECMESDNTLDMIDLMSQKKLIIFDFPDDDLVPLQQNVLINLINSKIDLATRLRRRVNGQEAEFPFFVEQDEPHKYLRSAKIWTSACVESRKWRVGYVWAFHYWEQIPKELQKAIKNALPHYHIYPTSPETWKGLADIISPFTVEDGLKLQRWHAINVIRSGGGVVTPFIAKMSSPLSERFKKQG